MKKELFFVIVLSLFCTVAPAQKIERLKGFDTSKEAHVTAALNAFSFNIELDNYTFKKGDTGKKMTLFDLIDYCALHKIKALDATGYWIEGYPAVPSDEYIYELKRYAHKKGVDISGTGIRNNFADPDPVRRAADVKLAKAWIDVASKLGAPVIRTFAGPIPSGYENKWEEVAGWMIDCYKEVAAYGASKGVLVGIQNHGDMIKTADQIIYIVKAVNSSWFGIILDTGYFMTEDPYVDMDKVMPYVINWQVKESAFGKSSDVRIDLARIMKIIKKHGYRGYLPIETLAGDRAYDPYTAVPVLMKELNDAIAAEFGNSTLL